MIHLLYFEIRKNFIRKYILIIFFAFLLLNFLFIYYHYVKGIDPTGYFLPHSETTKMRWEFYDKMHKKMDGQLTSNKAKHIIEENNKLTNIISDGTYSKKYQLDTNTGYYWSDYLMINKYFYKPMKYLSTYSININKIVQEAESNILFYSEYYNNYEVNRNTFIVDNYQGRFISLFYDTKPWEFLFNYEFTDLLIILLILLVVVPIFIGEKESNMYYIILTSMIGRKSFTIVKVLSVLIFIISLVSIFSISNYIFIKALYGLNGYELPIYAIEKFQYTPLNYSLLTSYVILQLLKIIGLFSFSMSVLTMSFLFSKVVYPYMISTFIVIGGIYVRGYVSSVENVKFFLSSLSPFTLLNGNNLFQQLLDINIQGNFFLKTDICIFSQCSIIIFFYIFLYLLNKKRNVLKLPHFLFIKEALD